MTDHRQIIEEAKQQLDKLSGEFDELEAKVKAGRQGAGAVYEQQLAKLRQQWKDADTRLDQLAADGKAEAGTIKTEAEQHWKALKAAVQTYRNQIERMPPAA